MAGYRVAIAGAVIASTGLAAWALLRRRGDLQRETAQRLAAEQQCKLLRAEVERLEAALSVALRREEERVREAQRHEAFFAEERDALEVAREALAAREEQHRAEQVEARKVLESSRERSAELRRHNAEKAETVEQLRLELEALRRATKKTSCGRQLISAQRLDFPNASRSASRLDHIGHDGTDSKCMFRSYRIRTA